MEFTAAGKIPLTLVQNEVVLGQASQWSSLSLFLIEPQTFEMSYTIWELVWF